jgi:hypothetical protein
MRYAYGVKKETFRRWMFQGAKFPERVPVNKGKTIIEDKAMAASYFTPKRLFMQHEMERFVKSNEGRKATKEDKQVHRAFLKKYFNNLPVDVMEVYEKVSRERLAYHGFIEEALVDTLNDNNEQPSINWTRYNVQNSRPIIYCSRLT